MHAGVYLPVCQSCYIAACGFCETFRVPKDRIVEGEPEAIECEP